MDLLVSTHPDQDHINGLKKVVEDRSIEIDLLWMHTPWRRNAQLEATLAGTALESQAIRLADKQRASLSTARELEAIARRRGIPIEQPYTGMMFQGATGGIRVLGPSEWFFESVYQNVNSDRQAREAVQVWAGNVLGTNTATQTRTTVQESWLEESLQDPDDDATSPRNNSSAILLIEANIGTEYEVVPRRFLLTADAGTPALEQAMDYANSCGIDLKACCGQQIPHHGSKRNIGPSVLDGLVGTRRQIDDGRRHMAAFVSACKDNSDQKHPTFRVTNAYQRRGATVRVTAGSHWHFPYGCCPSRGWNTGTLPFGFFTGEVETGDDE